MGSLHVNRQQEGWAAEEERRILTRGPVPQEETRLVRVHALLTERPVDEQELPELTGRSRHTPRRGSHALGPGQCRLL